MFAAHAAFQTGRGIPVDTNGLVVHYDANTYSGTTWTNLASPGTYDGTMSNVTHSSSDGGTMSFNGSSSGVTLARPVQDDFTLVALFKTSQSSRYVGGTYWYAGVGLMYADAGGEADDFGLSIVDGKPTFGTGNPTVSAIPASTYNDNSWHCATATRTKSNGALTLYIDGASVATATGGTSSLTAQPTLYIGVTSYGGGFYLGLIGKILAYNRVLSASEVATNYNAIKR